MADSEGDIVMLEEGDKVSADIRLIEINGLQLNNATITGESDVLKRSAGPSQADSIFDADNIVFSGKSLARRGLFNNGHEQHHPLFL